MRILRYGKAPLAVAGILSFLIFLMSVLASSLAQERPVVFRWVHDGKLIVRYHNPSNANELRIWLAAFVPPLVMIAIGLAATWIRRGVYVSAAGGVAIVLLLTVRLDTWARHHALRFPLGSDNIPSADPSNLTARGEWEASAKSAALSLRNWAIGLAIGIAAISLIVELRRRRGAVPPPPPPPPEMVTGASEVVRGGHGELV